MYFHFLKNFLKLGQISSVQGNFLTTTSFPGSSSLQVRTQALTSVMRQNRGTYKDKQVI